MKKIALVVGARPNFMKIAPVLRELKSFPDHFEPLLVHTGQHYDNNMSNIFFEELSMPLARCLPGSRVRLPRGADGKDHGKVRKGAP